MASSITYEFDMKPIDQILRERGVNDYGRVQKYIDRECINRMAKYTPMDTRALIDSATKMSKIGSGEIRQGGSLAPYGRKWYYTQAKFTGAPIRGTRWFERMVNANRNIILKGAMREAGIK